MVWNTFCLGPDKRMNRAAVESFRTSPAVAGVFSLAILFLSACAPDGGPATGGPQTTDNGGGEAVFNENCSACHGAEGRGPKLAEIKALPADELRNRIRNHPIAGQIPQRLPANQLADVIDFLESE